MAVDIYKGWPHRGALDDTAQPKDGEDIKAGMVITKDANGLLIKATSTSPLVFFALENQDDKAVIGAQRMAYIVKNAILLTDQYDDTQTYAIGTRLGISDTNPGILVPYTAGIFVGYSDGFIERDGIRYLKVIFQ